MENKLTESEKFSIIGMHDAGKNLTEICSVIRKNGDVVSAFLHSCGRVPITKGKPFKISPEKEQKCIQMHKEGYGFQEIAYELAIGKSTARKICKRHDEAVRESNTDTMLSDAVNEDYTKNVIEGLEMALQGIMTAIAALKQMEEEHEHH